MPFSGRTCSQFKCVGCARSWVLPQPWHCIIISFLIHWYSTELQIQTKHPATCLVSIFMNRELWEQIFIYIISTIFLFFLLVGLELLYTPSCPRWPISVSTVLIISSAPFYNRKHYGIDSHVKVVKIA